VALGHPPDPERLRQLLGGPRTRRLVEALRRRLEQGRDDGVLTLGEPSEAERKALDALLGRAPTRGRKLSLRLSDLEAVLRGSGAAPDLRTALMILGGPLRDREAERRAADGAWQAVRERMAPAAASLGLDGWLDELFGSGLLKRLSGSGPEQAERLLAAALAVLGRLPGSGVALSTLAAQALGDAHALDPGQPVTALIRRALLASASPGAAPRDEEADFWARVGVLSGGGVTSQVLVLGLPAGGAGATAAMLRALAAEGEPALLTLRQVLRGGTIWPLVGRDVFVCENPAVLAEAATGLGPGCRPLVCTAGQPSAAVFALLAQLRRAGARLRYHGDFDWPGIRIANGLMARAGTVPWRMSTADYLAASDTGNPLAGEPVAAAWNPSLTEAMRQRGQVVEEECVVRELLEDLIAD
jgi:uncharacterized protein (TIGR02679 family)